MQRARMLTILRATTTSERMRHRWALGFAFIGSSVAAQAAPEGDFACPSGAPAARDSATSAVARDNAPRIDSVARAGSFVTSPRSEGANPTIVVLAAAQVREVRFAKQPQVLVRLCGAASDSVRVIERRNLPDPIQPGTTYRDVYIAVEIIGKLNADCIARRITGQADAGGVCASLSARDSTAASIQRRPP